MIYGETNRVQFISEDDDGEDTTFQLEGRPTEMRIEKTGV